MGSQGSGVVGGRGSMRETYVISFAHFQWLPLEVLTWDSTVQAAASDLYKVGLAPLLQMGT